MATTYFRGCPVTVVKYSGARALVKVGDTTVWCLVRELLTDLSEK